mgnify:CR=1 FL=1
MAERAASEYNHELCIRLHQELDKRLESGENTMNAIYAILRDNGKVGLMTRVDRLEQAFVSLQKMQERRDSMIWRFIQPGLPLFYGLVAAAVWAYIQNR